MERVKLDCVYGVQRGQIMYRTRGVELAPTDRRKPLRKPDDPITLHGIHLGEFAVFFSVKTSLVRKPRYTTASYLITQVNRKTQQAVALPG